MPVNFDTLNQQMAAMMQGLQASPFVLDPSRLTGDPAANASLLYPTGSANKKPFVPASPMGMPGQGGMGAQQASPFAMPQGQPQIAFPAAASALAAPQASPMAFMSSAPTGGAPAAPGGAPADPSGMQSSGGGLPPGLLAMLAVGRSQGAAQELQRGLVPQGMTGQDITSLIDQTRQMGMLGAFGLKPDFQFDVRQLAGGEDTPQSQWMRDLLQAPAPAAPMSQGR